MPPGPTARSRAGVGSAAATMVAPGIPDGSRPAASARSRAAIPARRGTRSVPFPLDSPPMLRGVWGTGWRVRKGHWVLLPLCDPGMFLGGGSPPRPREANVTTLTDSEWRKLARDLAHRVHVVAPDWTDTNQHDPGVTIVELIAFLAELLFYRQDRSPRAQARLLAIVEELSDRVRKGSCSDVPALTRNRYFFGKVMGVDDFSAEQDYLRDKHRRHNLLLHGVGVVWGLDVSVHTSQANGGQISVTPGLAVGPDGEELLVCEPLTSALGSARSPSIVTLRRVDRPLVEVPTQDGAEASRVEEVVEVEVVEDAPASHLAIARMKRSGRAWRLDPTFSPRRL